MRPARNSGGLMGEGWVFWSAAPGGCSVGRSSRRQAEARNVAQHLRGQLNEIQCPGPFKEALRSDFADHHLPDELLTPLVRIQVNPIQP